MKSISIRLFSEFFRLIILLCICLCLLSDTIAQDDTFFKKKEIGNKGDPKILYGQASFYANKFNGRRTASGEIFQQTKMTCASNKIKMGTWVRVINIRNGRSVIVRVNDRLHHKMKRLLDLTSAAAKKLGFTAAGLTKVKVEIFGKAMPEPE